MGQDYYEGEDCNAILRHLAWLQKQNPELDVEIMVADTLQVFNATDPCQLAGSIKKNEERWWDVEPIKEWDIVQDDKPLEPGTIKLTYSDNAVTYQGKFGDYSFVCDAQGKKIYDFSGEIVRDQVDNDNVVKSILNDVARKSGTDWEKRNRESFKFTFRHWDDCVVNEEANAYINTLFKDDIRFRLLVLGKISRYMQSRTNGKEAKFWKICPAIINKAIASDDFSFKKNPVVHELLEALETRQDYFRYILEYILSETAVLMCVWAKEYSHIYYKGEEPLFDYLFKVVKNAPRWVSYDTKKTDLLHDQLNKKYLSAKLLKLDDDDNYITPHFTMGSEKRVVSYNELRRIIDNEDNKNIFIDAPAGAGKSTLCRYITKFMAEKNKLVFLLTPFDCLKINDIKSLLKHLVQITNEEALDYWKNNLSSENMPPLFIFDDYERVKNKKEIDDFIYTLAARKHRIMVVSNNVCTRPNIIFSQKLTVNKFLDEDVTRYVLKNSGVGIFEKIFKERSKDGSQRIFIPRALSAQPILLATLKELIAKGDGLTASEKTYEPNVLLLFEKYFELRIQQAIKSDKSLRKKVYYSEVGQHADNPGAIVAHYSFKVDQIVIFFNKYVVERIDIKEKESKENVLKKAKNITINKVLAHYYLLKIAECLYGFYDSINNCIPAEHLESVMSKQALSCIGQIQFDGMGGYNAPKMTYNFLLTYYVFHHEDVILHFLNDKIEMDLSSISDFLTRFNIENGCKGYFSICEDLFEMLLLRATSVDVQVFYNIIMRLFCCIQESMELLYDFLLLYSRLHKNHQIDQKDLMLSEYLEINIETGFEDMVFGQNNAALFSYMLHHAVMKGATDITNILVTQLKGASKEFRKNPNLLLDPNKYGESNKEYWTLLHKACKNGDIDHVKILVKEFPDLLKIRSKEGINVFHAACGSNSIELLEWFHQNYRSLIMQKGTHHASSLHWAANCGSFMTIEWLLEKFPRHFKINEREDLGNNVLQIAAAAGGIECVSWLLELHPKLLMSKNKDGSTALHKACVSKQSEMAIWLIEHYPELILIKDNNDSTALHEASAKGLLEVVRVLIQKQPSLLLSTGKTGTALTAACLSDHLDIAKLLIAHEPELLNIDGEFTYSTARRNGHTHILEWLLTQSPTLSKKINHESRRLLANLQASNTDNVVVLESPRTQKMKRIITAAKDNELQELISLLEEDKKLIQARGQKEFNLLHYACIAGHVDIARILLIAGPELSQSKNQAGSVPLDLARLFHRDKVVELFETVLSESKAI